MAWTADSDCVLAFHEHHTEQMNDFTHTVTVEATGNIVPLCMNRQMNDAVSQN